MDLSRRARTSLRVARWLLFAGTLVAGAPAAELGKLTEAQGLLPLAPGLTLPVRLSHGLKASTAKPGSAVRCLTTQRLPISATEFLPAGVEVLGTVTAAGAQPATLAVRFTTLRWHGHTVPAALRTLAIANFSNAEDTYDPILGGGDRENNTPANWTTRQVGGDVLTRFNWQGELDNERTQRVGFSDFYGVYADPTAPTSSDPRPLPHAVGIFSTTAHGLYGFPEGTVLQAAPDGVGITGRGDFQLRTGDQLLLEVVAAPQGIQGLQQP